MQRLERLEHDHRPAFHVGCAGAVGARAVAAEGLAGEHGVDVAEQQQALAAGATGLGHEVPRPLHFRRQFDPSRAEADGPKLRGEDLTDRAHAGDVLGRAFDVHDSGEHRLGGRLARGDVLRDGGFLRVQRSLRGGDAAEREYERLDYGANGDSGHGGFPVATSPAR